MMMRLRAFFLLFCLLGEPLGGCCLGPALALAEDLQIAEVVTTRLNLREGPSASFRVVGELLEGSRVTLFSNGTGNWVQVAAVVGNKPIVGWANRAYVRVLPSPPPAPSANSSPPATTPPSSAPTSAPPAKTIYLAPPPPLSVTNTDLECHNSFVDDGYRDCEATVDVTYKGHPDVEGQFSVDCEVTAQLDFKDSFVGTTRTFDGSDTLYVSYGYGNTTVSVDIDPGFHIDPLVRVRLTDVSCRYGR